MIASSASCARAQAESPWSLVTLAAATPEAGVPSLAGVGVVLRNRNTEAKRPEPRSLSMCHDVPCQTISRSLLSWHDGAAVEASVPPLVGHDLGIRSSVRRRPAQNSLLGYLGDPVSQSWIRQSGLGSSWPRFCHSGRRAR